jgi:phosphonopyruvate decarboxylase
MIDCRKFLQLLNNGGISFFTGVPDSLLKSFSSYLLDHCKPSQHIIAANEGGAVALAAGHYLATERTALVYMQNSGEGNAVNPLVSLMDPAVYGIPVLLLIGWRGEPGTEDEPQHVKQGEITTALLNALQIPFEVIPASLEQAALTLDRAVSHMNRKSSPFALIVRKDTFEPYESEPPESRASLSREEAIVLVANSLNETDVVVATTGKIGRELFEHRENQGSSHEKDFLTVGSMGHASQIALGIAIVKKDRKVFCLDGDGAFIMHMGAAAITGALGLPNFCHIVLNNGCHDSVGGQPTAGLAINIPQIAKACGYRLALTASSPEEVQKSLQVLSQSKGPSLLEIRVKPGARENLGRPTTSPHRNKQQFMGFLRRTDPVYAGTCKEN